MGLGYIVDKDTGKQLYYGHTENKQKLIDAGHTVLSADNVRPDALHVWNGSRWVESKDLKDAAAALEKESKIRKTDRNMPAIAEDLINILIAKGVLSLSDFAQDSQNKFTERKNLRR